MAGCRALRREESSSLRSGLSRGGGAGTERGSSPGFVERPRHCRTSLQVWEGPRQGTPRPLPSGAVFTLPDEGPARAPEAFPFPPSLPSISCHFLSTHSLRVFDPRVLQRQGHCSARLGAGFPRPAVWVPVQALPLSSWVTSLCLGFLICTTGIVMVPIL